jgi:hypothetical protein
MPRKPRAEKKTVVIRVNDAPVSVILHPPAGRRTSWYAYTAGWVSSKSTGQRNLEEAIVVAESMVRGSLARGNPPRPVLSDLLMSDDEFEAIQKEHYGKKQGAEAQARAAKSLQSCLEAIRAFRVISGLKPITKATPDNCAAFQRNALKLPKTTLHPYPNSKKGAASYSANTVVKWSVALQAAWERASRTGGKKCVRGVVAEQQLLTDNPWKHFPWIEGYDRPIRQFDGAELLCLQNYLEQKWVGVTVACLLAKVLLWSSGRRSEIVGLTWDQLRVVGPERHFQVVGKWGVRKWFRVPDGLYQELLAIRTSGPYVFAAYPQQIRRFYEKSDRPGTAKMISSTFNPGCLGDWFHERLAEWSKSLPKGGASTHIFRKTSLQYARRGEDVSRKVAEDARVSERVLMTHYVEESDPEMCEASNRIYRRILASLPPEVARRYGHAEVRVVSVEDRLQEAIAAKDWKMVAELSARLAAGPPQPADREAAR